MLEKETCFHYLICLKKQNKCHVFMWCTISERKPMLSQGRCPSYIPGTYENGSSLAGAKK